MHLKGGFMTHGGLQMAALQKLSQPIHQPEIIGPKSLTRNH
jgi:hypothetical protein